MQGQAPKPAETGATSPHAFLVGWVVIATLSFQPRAKSSTLNPHRTTVRRATIDAGLGAEMDKNRSDLAPRFSGGMGRISCNILPASR